VRFEKLDEALRHRAGCLPEQRPPPFPAGRDRAPGIELLLPRVYAAVPVSNGITCFPYASSVASCPCVIK
jgi:hypothetical protein